MAKSNPDQKAFDTSPKNASQGLDTGVEGEPFFRKVDWMAFGTTLAISLGVYLYTLAPTVTLEDSGELAVAADYLGVPHPPGYPIWTLLAWFFQWIFHWVTYYGHPNPAWSVGLMSAIFGALSCAILALLVSRSAFDMLRGMRNVTEVLGVKTESHLCWAGGVAGGLLFAFSSVLWSQSVIVEVYSLNAFFVTLIFLLTYRWMCRPHENSTLFIIAFLFGLGFTNHQTIVFAVPALVFTVAFRDMKLFRDCMVGGLMLFAVYLFWKASKITGDPLPVEDVTRKTRYIITGITLIALPGPIAFFMARELFTEWRRFLILVGLGALGVSFYFYLPIASDQNPPMNWGYPRTEEGFWHALTRGQYEKFTVLDNLKIMFANPGHYIALLNSIIFNPTGYTSVVAQFTWPLAGFAILAFVFFVRVQWREQSWLLVTFVGFVFLTAIFVIVQWPDRDVQTLFIGRVQYIQAHAIYALWISYGLIFGLAWVDTHTRGSPLVKYAGIGLAFLLPLVLVHRNVYNEEYVQTAGGVEQNGHDFGWQFGHYQLRGIHAITNELQEGETPPPSATYPPEMDPDAIFFGGTDPGRFVPTYMIYSAKVRPDVFLITQNALADNTYMNVMRDLYGDQMWIPAVSDSNQAFKQYVDDVRSGRISAGAAVVEKGGRVSVQGVQGVMMINGILTKFIFDQNRHKHSFYVEESYVIPWMYPYLTPHGLIMKINHDPLPRLPDELVKNDHDFWEWYSKRLFDNPKFHRDVVARKTFSKLRSAIGGLYVHRRNYPEAENAFKQAILLYDLSPEANFRLADAYTQQRKFDEAIDQISQFLEKDPDNDKVRAYKNKLISTRDQDQRRVVLEEQLTKGADIESALELLEIYRNLGQGRQFRTLAVRILNDPRVPVEVCRRIGEISKKGRNFNMALQAYTKLVQRSTNDYLGYIELAAVHMATRKYQESLQALQQAVKLGGESARRVIRSDERFKPIASSAAFQQHVPPVGANGFTLPFGAGVK
jgi:tetratricopeptide (TPR) repeat protein